MASLDEILACYGDLAATVARMVELARGRCWDRLPALDARCTAIVERLRRMDPGAVSGVERSRVAAVASRIQCDQDELATLLRPQFTQLVRRVAELQAAS